MSLPDRGIGGDRQQLDTVRSARYEAFAFS
jgi:hypothetical protein